MSSEENRVVLHAFWASPYSKRVQLALKIKGINFEYVEEDLTNKSPMLLEYNPIHKKVPVLVHNGKPIVESLVIIEYIDETWKNEPCLFPKDPYNRTRVRFWCTYFQQLFESNGKLLMSEGKEAQESALKEVHEKLDIIEKGMKDVFVENPRSTNGENLDVLDIMAVATVGGFRALEECLEIKIFDQENHPLIHKWIRDLEEFPVLKETSPPDERFVAFLRMFKTR